MKLVAFDLETHLIDDGLLAPRPVCLSWRYLVAPAEHWQGYEQLSLRSVHRRPEYAREAGLLDLAEGLAWLRSALEDPAVHFVNQTIAFDFGCMAAEDPELLPLIFAAYDAGRVSCTKIRERLIAIALGVLADDDRQAAKFDLATLTKTYTGRDRTAVKSGADAWRLRYGELDGVPLEAWPVEAVTYPLGDTEDAIDVFTGQIAAAERAGILSEDGYRLTNEPEQVAAAWALHLAGCWGMRANAPRVAVLAEQIAERAKKLDALKHDLGLFKAPKIVKGIEKPPTNDKKALQALVVKAYAGAPPMTKGRVDKKASEAAGREIRTPEPATDKETLLNSGDELLIEIAEAGDSLSAVRNTFLPALVRAVNAPVCPSWQALVASGRISCWAPNLTNQPRTGGVRECWEARPGYVFANADYSIAELRSLAQVTYTLFGVSSMRDALNDGKELHLLTASTILGISYEECVRRYKAGSPDVCDKKKGGRQLAKPVNFGFPGGMGPETFVKTAWKDYRIKLAETNEGAIQRARELRLLWLETYPEVKAYFRYISERGEIFELRQHRSGRLRGGLSYCSGANTLFQGLTADGVKAALYFASRECYTGESEAWNPPAVSGPAFSGKQRSPLFGSRVNAMIHDELMCESPEKVAPEAAVRLGEVMVHGMQIYTPDVQTVVEPVLMRRWYKDAKPKFNGAGKLVPWEPE